MAISASGPPEGMAELILFVPPLASATHESRGMPYSVARCSPGLMPRIWIESDRPWSIGVPGRASEPSTRMKIGSFPLSAVP